MSRDPRYQKLLNSKQWQEVKAIVWKRANGLCEMCMKEGIITGSGTTQLDCHHIRPVEGAHTVEGPDGMRARCYDPNNIMLVCQDCHIKIHTEAKSHTKEKVQENKARARRRFMEANDPNYKEENNGIQTKVHTGLIREPSTDRASEAQAQTDSEGNGGGQGDVG